MIIVGGVMRSGKSLFSSQLARRKGYSCISTDYLILLLRDLFPESGIGEPGRKYDELCDRFLPFCSKLIARLGEDDLQDYVVEGYYIRPRDVSNLVDTRNVLFFGYPEILPEAKLKQLREYGMRHTCYTNEMSDEKLLSYVRHWIVESQALRQECLDLNLRFVDVSDGFTPLFDELLEIFA